MKLWKISQADNGGYDTYDSAVVAAETEDEARNINPDGEWNRHYSSWSESPSLVSVEYLGEAKIGTEAGIILASFNAG